MATDCLSSPGWSLVRLIWIFHLLISVNCDPSQKEGDGSNPIGVVHFNNPKLLEGLDKEDDDFGYDMSQESTSPQLMGGIAIREEARILGKKLRKLSNVEIGVTSMQAIYDSMPYSETSPDLQLQLDKVSGGVQRKLQQYLKVLRTSKMTVENLQHEFQAQPAFSQRLPCCNLHPHQLSSSPQYGCRISEQQTCDLVPPSAPPTAFNPGRNLTEVFQHNHVLLPSIKWQYFISRAGIHNEYPAHNFNNLPYADCKNKQDFRHREEYVWTTHPYRKSIVILVDHGNSLSSNQLYTAQAIARHMLNALNEHDRVGVIGVSDKGRYASLDGCLDNQLVPFTEEVKLVFTNFVDKLKKMEVSANHSAGFASAFRMIRNTPNISMETGPLLIAYISRGLMRSLTDGKQVLRVIARDNRLLANRVIINTYVLIDDEKPIMYETEFMQDIAAQNFGSIEHLQSPAVQSGVMRLINTTRDLGATVGDFYYLHNQSTPDRPHLFLPKLDTVGTGVTVGLTWPVFADQRHLFGIMGLEVEAVDLMESVTYFTHPDKSTYAFLINSHGYTLMHPSLERPLLTNKQPMYTDISHYEFEPGFENIRQLILEHDNGHHNLEVPRSPNNSSHQNDLHTLPHFITITYRWKKIKIPEMNQEAPLIVVIRSVVRVMKFRDIVDVGALTVPPLVYHRLDLLPTDTTCMHLKQLATLDTSALFLSAGSFLNPYEHLSQPETKHIVQGYLAYLSDQSGLIANPGFKAGVPTDALAVAQINQAWLHQTWRSDLNNFIVRRYVATPSGVFQMFPGTLLNKAYDPTKRDWYTRALEYPGKVVLTAPYLDKGGAGYIVTISHTIYEGKTAALHGPLDRVVAVMGLDLALGYFYKLVIEQQPACERPHIRCFIMDDRGYLITHRSLIEANSHGPLEQQHVTHKEPLVANDILNHRGFVRKKLCNSYNDRTIQRFYQFNTSINDMLTNLVHGEHCSRYQVVPIHGTNTFFGIVNQTCPMATAFCPCSMVDRLCLNCHRMEQHECECPCECPLEMDYCSGDILDHKDINPSCPRLHDEVAVVHYEDRDERRLPQCINTRCTQRHSKHECLGVIDCEWCALDTDGKTLLDKPFCSTQRVCFAGILGASTPYHDEVKALRHESAPALGSTPVGPVAGGIMGCFLVLALGLYCYRHHATRGGHVYMGSLPDHAGRCGQLDNELEEIEPQDDSGHTNTIVLATFDNPATISPYRVSTSYRRPPGGESDHGYSTMTPHEDSEQASTACLEPLIIGRDRYRPTTTRSTTGMIPPPPSKERPSRSPTPPGLTCVPVSPADGANKTLVPGQDLPSPVPGQTLLPEEPHRILANVTVHMVDSH